MRHEKSFNLIYNPQILSSHLTKPLKIKKRIHLGALAGAAAGCFGSSFYSNTGSGTAIHEVVGHGMLGMQLTTDFTDGKAPTYWVSGFDQFNAIGQADTPLEKIKAVFSWLFIPPPSDNGAVGRATWGEGHPNELAKTMGDAGQHAWISLAGSVPELIIDTTCVVGGMALRRKYPALGWGLVSFSLVNNFSRALYPASAAIMSANEMQEAAQQGHDFANFALCMSKYTGLAASTIAISTAVFWMSFVPLIALAMYLYQKSHQANAVPDEIALKYWLSKLSIDGEKHKTFQSLLKKYPKKKSLPFYNKSNVAISQSLEKQQETMEDFMGYLARNLPPDEIYQAKEELFRQWQHLKKESLLEKIFGYTKVTAGIFGVTAQLTRILALTIVPSLLPFAVIFHTLFPLLGLIALAQNGAEIYNDFRKPSSQIPILAKVFSGLKLAITLAMTAISFAATFVPGMQFLLIPTLLLGAVLTILLNFAKHKVLQYEFRSQTVEEEPSEAKKGLSRYGFFSCCLRKESKEAVDEAAYSSASDDEQSPLLAARAA